MDIERQDDRGQRLCVAALVTNERGQVLLVEHRERGWELPGGKVLRGERCAAAMLREGEEEAGLKFQLAGNPVLVEADSPDDPCGSMAVLLYRGDAAGDPVPNDPTGLVVRARWFMASEVPWALLSPLPTVAHLQSWAGSGDVAGYLRISAVAEVVGLTTATLRVWERRYGIPKPARNGSGVYRLYGPADIARVKVMKETIAKGVSPAQAAEVAKQVFQ